mmetsp:Transcript_39038/g.124274  ORF Transcript_39038/g.124274 Transcript_39038/m.124274 type:complete len:140 (-) Transcript_39038:555-974(-)
MDVAATVAQLIEEPDGMPPARNLADIIQRQVEEHELPIGDPLADEHNYRQAGIRFATFMHSLQRAMEIEDLDDLGMQIGLATVGPWPGPDPVIPYGANVAQLRDEAKVRNKQRRHAAYVEVVDLFHSWCPCFHGRWPAP